MAVDAPTYVPTIQAVQWAIRTLQRCKIHPFFIAYLHIHKRSVVTASRTVHPIWDELAELLTVADGPPNKPYYRPFWHSNLDDEGRYWLNRNLAGSFAPSSIREIPRRVVSVTGSEYTLLDDDVHLALDNLLYGTRVSGVAMGTYLFRDFGLVTDDGGMPAPTDPAEILRREFMFDNDEFSILFSDDGPPGSIVGFELLTEQTPGVE